MGTDIQAGYDVCPVINKNKRKDKNKEIELISVILTSQIAEVTVLTQKK